MVSHAPLHSFMRKASVLDKEQYSTEGRLDLHQEAYNLGKEKFHNSMI